MSEALVSAGGELRSAPTAGLTSGVPIVTPGPGGALGPLPPFLWGLTSP